MLENLDKYLFMLYILYQSTRELPKKELYMKKIFGTALAVISAIALLSGCKKKDSSITIKVGATPVPHEGLLNLVKDDLAASGIKLDIIEFNDYVTPNSAVESGDLDANFFQHKPYLDSFNSEHGTHLVDIGGIHIEPFALYSKKYSKLEEIPEGATIAIPNDPTNEGRALLLLQAANLITLKSDAGLEATPVSIESNPKNFKFTEVEAASLPRVLPDVDAAAINGNYALAVGLNSTKDGLFVEGKDSPYVNIVVTKAGRENDSALKALVNALQTQKVRDWVKENYPNGDVVTVF